MTKKELESILDAYAEKVVERVVERVVAQLNGTPKDDKPEMVGAPEAAKILGISRNYLLSIKDRFNYIKVGENKQSRIFFRKETLFDEYLGNGCDTVSVSK